MMSDSSDLTGGLYQAFAALFRIFQVGELF